MRHYTNESFIESFEESIMLGYISDNLDEKFNDMINHFVNTYRIKTTESGLFKYYCKKDIKRLWDTYNDNKHNIPFIYYSEIIKQTIYNLKILSISQNKETYEQYKYEYDNIALVERKEKIERIKNGIKKI